MDESHLGLVSRSKFPLDCRLLYDSWLWRAVLVEVMPVRDCSAVVELLPGSSLTIPVALESAGFRGVLHRVNDVAPSPLPVSFRSHDSWIPIRLERILNETLPALVIVGNHIIDDLLFDACFGGPGVSSEQYLNPTLCKALWASLVDSKLRCRVQASVVRLFAELARRMASGSTMILRHYPSTFALMSDDRVRMHVEMETFSQVGRALADIEGCEAEWLDTSGIDAPAGSHYPNSFLFVAKTA